jgi:hypothetical protein
MTLEEDVIALESKYGEETSLRLAVDEAVHPEKARRAHADLRRVMETIRQLESRLVKYLEEGREEMQQGLR